MRTDPSNEGPARRLAEDVHQLRGAAAEGEAMRASTACVLDFFACALAGLAEPVSAEVGRSVDQPAGAGQATLLSTGGRTSAPAAALANGTQAHALDYDDNLWTYNGHSTAVIFSAALAVAEAQRRGGRDLLAALALGTEAAHRIGSPVTPALARAGWHPSSVVGVFGAAVAASLLMDLDVGATAAALNLATSMAAGIRQNFGSKAKPLVIGWASQSGVMAAIFASQGISGAADAFDGPQGFYATYAGHVPPGALSREPPDHPLAIVSPGTAFKAYPCCTGTHPAIEAAMAVRQDHSPALDEIEAIRIEVTPEVLGELIYPVPSDGTQARFSLPYCAAVALVHGRVGLEHFSDGAVHDPEIRALMKLIEVLPDETLVRLGGANCPAARATVVVRGGAEIHRSVHAARGNPGNPMSREELVKKFSHCAAAVGLPRGQTDGLVSQIMDIGDVPCIGTWMEAEVAPAFRLAGGC